MRATQPPEYRAWIRMHQRVRGVLPSYKKDYTDRGITVCARWTLGEGGKTGAQCFLADLGPRPSPRHTLDRIKNDKGYEPGNCQWGTRAQQARNRRCNALAPQQIAIVKGLRLKHGEGRQIAEAHGAPESTIYHARSGKSYAEIDPLVLVIQGVES